MIFNFDLISDLHIETWNSQIPWSGMATSPYCIVAGDVSRDRALVIDTLEQLSESYKGVFYIDGNAEHKDYAEDLNSSYLELESLISSISKVVYMQDNAVIINGVAILATNGWWSYDLDPALDIDQSIKWVQDKDRISQEAAIGINGVAYHDAAYMVNSVSKLQTQNDVKSIVMVTHTVPESWIVKHDADLADTWRFNSMGNRAMSMALSMDTERKIKTWCFGHYHRPIDTIKNGIRYVSNPRGAGNTEYSQVVYYPKRISITI